MAVKARGNITFTFNSVALTNYMNSADIDAALDMLDTTNFGSTAKEEIADDTKWGFSTGGLLDIAVDNALCPEMITPGTYRTAVITYDLGAQTVTLTWTSKALVSNYKVSGKVGDLQSWTADFSLSGAPLRAVA
jgi:hypothetical protein